MFLFFVEQMGTEQDKPWAMALVVSDSTQETSLCTRMAFLHQITAGRCRVGIHPLPWTLLQNLVNHGGLAGG